MTSSDDHQRMREPALSLGTATFGSDYGIANHGKGTTSSDVKQILNEASELNISHLDTASSYGRAEQLIGQFWPKGRPLKITTKVSPDDCKTASSIFSAVQKSLAATQAVEFWSVLLHDPTELLGGNGSEIRNGLLQVLDAGLATRIGISAYSEREVELAKDYMPELTVFQIPENLCDRRKYHSTNLGEMSQQGDQFFVRSVFLQGLLLMNPKEVPWEVRDAVGVLKILNDFCLERSISVLDLCLGYAKSIPWASGVVVGVASVEQLRKFNSSFHSTAYEEFSEVPVLGDWLIDPRNWS